MAVKVQMEITVEDVMAKVKELVKDYKATLETAIDMREVGNAQGAITALKKVLDFPLAVQKEREWDEAEKPDYRQGTAGNAY